MFVFPLKEKGWQQLRNNCKSFWGNQILLTYHQLLATYDTMPPIANSQFYLFSWAICACKTQSEKVRKSCGTYLTLGSAAITVNLSPMLVCMKMGLAVAPSTAQSIKECLLIKLRLASGRFWVFWWHKPGRGTGICDLEVGSQLEFTVCWFLNGPSSNAEEMSDNLKAQMALPAMALSGVVKTP